MSPKKTGRDHLAFRGYYYPQKSVVDGDLCEAFSLLGQDQQKGIAEVRQTFSSSFSSQTLGNGSTTRRSFEKAGRY